MACVYGWFVGAVVYKRVGVKELLGILKSSGLMSATLLLITAGASAFSWLLAVSGTPTALASQVFSLTESPTQVTALFNLVMIVAGFFLDSASAIIVLSPLLQPIAAQVGIDPTHFGVITLINFSVGMLTPPVGLNLFVAVAISKMSLIEVFKSCLPFILLMFVALLMITYVPWISMAIPNLIY